jgi:cyclopropane-fatty-acyl-phospholipid synthase
MVEHVGRTQLPTYVATAYRLLKPGSLLLNHGVVTLQATASPLRRTLTHEVWRHTSFIQRSIFPDGELIPSGEMIQRAEAAQFEAQDLERLREQYVVTLRHWRHRLEANHQRAAALWAKPCIAPGACIWRGQQRRLRRGGLAVFSCS